MCSVSTNFNSNNLDSNLNHDGSNQIMNKKLNINLSRFNSGSNQGLWIKNYRKGLAMKIKETLK